ncbi:MAG: type II toxin-antitoxin system VapC family toxin [Xanthomonadaceae bacterium]|nr:type II toxin-antitoxin system VapC family toxin [Xanthomonadaceae bacterium]MDP2184360.1 type II toxin-antitoxin system VapC family toxin [Xanthomonadales bacterium]MDZ4114583.1 type II toxin-antitoxin system VapC family toxin [Xanthomonadaceae bacterium]MDZ4379664.1 type II toxin-antitoxin system VapC family toxin [Xanthomonadaceae bacterium]
MALVLDASSLLSFLHDEPGADRVWSALSGAMVCAVNWSEVVQKSLQRQANITGMRQEFTEAGVVFVPFTAEHAEIAALLWDKTRAFGLSLADRACLALAMERQLPILTADRAWSGLSLGLDIQFIR